MKPIQTQRAPAAIGPYVQANLLGALLYTSGQIPLQPESGSLVPGGIVEQTEQVIRNLSAVLEAGGSDLAHVVKTTCFLQDMADFAAFNEVYARMMPGKPARSCVAVAALPKGALVEIEAIAECC